MKDCIEATSQIPRPQLKRLFSCTGHLSAATPLISSPPSLSFLGLPQLSSLLPHHPLKTRAYWGSSVWPSSLPGGILSLKCRVGAQDWARGWEEGVQEGEEMLFILVLEAVGVGQRKKVQEPSFRSHLLG